MPRTLKTGDSYPELRMRLSDANGPVDLSTATGITVIGKKGATAIGPLTATADAPQSDPDLKGWITAPIAPADTAIDGEYLVVAKVIWAPNQQTTFPSTGTETLTIELNQNP
jgi:hypothetical protein